MTVVPAMAMERKAVTIIAAGLVGYSRMMATDEEGVISRLLDLRANVIDPSIAEQGRIIKTMGDGILVEFTSPAAAVRSAMAVQRAMGLRAANSPDAALMQFRIGINHGDVVIDGDDVLGDVVNIAARLESTSRPAVSVCSRAVHDEGFVGRGCAVLTSLGPHLVKNIPAPVETWCVEIDGVAVHRPTPIVMDKGQRASVAVLAFENLSADPEQGFWATGSPKTSPPSWPASGRCSSSLGARASPTGTRPSTCAGSPGSWGFAMW